MLGLTGSARHPDGRPASAGNKELVDQLIRQLGSNDFKLREDATRKLKEMDDALPAVHAAAQSSDLEVRRRRKTSLWSSKADRCANCSSTARFKSLTSSSTSSGPTRSCSTMTIGLPR
jgi:hypothetical protein